MAWRVAKSLDVLLAEVNARAPKRSKASDGSIGDPAHASRTSDHNPDRHGIVRARDFTDDPRGGHDSTRFMEFLRRSRDERIKYAIDDQGTGKGRMFSSYSTSTRKAWEWGPYSGPNTHSIHGHVSVVADSRADSTRPWGWATATTPEPPSEGRLMYMCKKGDESDAVEVLQETLVFLGAELKVDRVYGDATAKAVAQVLKSARPLNQVNGDRCRTIENKVIRRISEARIERALRIALRSVPSAQVDIDALAKEVADELVIGVKP